jgi:hypothetical protein
LIVLCPRRCLYFCRCCLPPSMALLSVNAIDTVTAAATAAPIPCYFRRNRCLCLCFRPCP